MSSAGYLPVSDYIWRTKYRYVHNHEVLDPDIEATWTRVARALASVEPTNSDEWRRRFYSLMENHKFLPAGRILASAGTQRQATLFNCFVMDTIEDSIDGIFSALRNGAVTMQQGGGVGYDFSTLRPFGSEAISAGSVASGPVSFMRMWDSMCATIQSTGARRGAMMATLRCDHPDIQIFTDAKRNPAELRHFNLSVLITDDFMEAVENNLDWPLIFPARDGVAGGEIYRTVSARDLWQKIMRATYDYAEPGVLFIDRINRTNNLHYCEKISATNPCGEIPLPPFGACDLGSLNLTTFVSQPFSEHARFDTTSMEASVATAVRMLDNVIDLSHYPLRQQQERARASRRIGLGVTGLADTLIMLGYKYGDEKSFRFAESMMKTLCHAAYRSSIELAKEKGIFPLFNTERYLAGEFIQSLPSEIKQDISGYGIRNSHLTAIAPTGTISLLADNVSSSIEPVFDFEYRRTVIESGGEKKQYLLRDYAYALWKQQATGETLPEHFVTAHNVTPINHLRMQAVVQRYVDNAVSKTINVPADFPFADFQDLYRQAYAMGLKGCTTFRPNAVTGSVLDTVEKPEEASHCCSIERETD